jgi:L-fuconolactonase
MKPDMKMAINLQKMPVIDAHHHLWQYSAEEYGWIDDSMPVLQRDFLPQDLERELAEAGIAGAVTVQARQTLEETQWLLSLAANCEAMCGVVGWAPIASESFPAILEGLTFQQKLVGLRHIVQAEAEGFLDAPDFQRGIAHLRNTGLVYDVLIFERQMEEAIRFVDRNPEQRFVVDHMAKPKIAAAEMEPWRSRMMELSKRPNVWCKVSGLTTEADWSHWSLESLRPYLDTVLDVFGPKRLMAGSDWPVCLVACGYTQWWNVLRDYFAPLSEHERGWIFGETAREVYRLGHIG